MHSAWTSEAKSPWNELFLLKLREMSQWVEVLSGRSIDLGLSLDTTRRPFDHTRGSCTSVPESTHARTHARAPVLFLTRGFLKVLI